MEIIAEIGSNWKRSNDDKSYKAAIQSIHKAAEMGATIVKFQVFTAETLYSKERAPRQYATVLKHELSLDWLSGLRKEAHENGVKFWASVFHPDLLPYAMPYLDGIKIASGDLTYIDLIKQASELSNRYEIPLAISTGAATFAEVETAVNWAKAYYPPTFYLFHCVSAYPANDVTMNLRGGLMFTKCDILGLSDHTLAFTASIIAVGMGYSIFEKHFRLTDTPETSPDFGHALNPTQFGDYVRALKQAEEIVGNGEKVPSYCEIDERVWARRGKDGLRPAND